MRCNGILMPIFSLPGAYGCGTIGKEARDFADFLAKSGQKIWQILPVGPIGDSASPYQCDSAFAGNPYFIDPEQLCKEGLVTRAECDAAKLPAEGPVDWPAVAAAREPLLRAAAARFFAAPPAEWEEFCRKETWWVDDWAMYRVAKDLNGGKAVWNWPEPLRRRWGDTMGRHWFDNQPEINYYKFLQFEFYRQWAEFKKYVNDKGIQLFGDIPIYVSPDSADVWARPDLFQLNEEGRPSKIAGVPPDAFSADGQLWGNPLYDWQAHEWEGFSWWAGRIGCSLRLYDLVRIDHFRGIESYWAIPAEEKSAINGEWVKGPGMKLFWALREKLGDLPIVAEDLGILTDEVRWLLKDSGFPGMKVLQFAFDAGPGNEYLPHNHVPNSVVYTGTHDNSTTKDWLKTADRKTVAFVKKYLNAHPGDDLVEAMIRAAYASCAARCVVPMADWLGLGAEGRINTPSTVGCNWSWRMAAGAADAALAKRIRQMGLLYARCWDEPKKAKKAEESAEKAAE